MTYKAIALYTLYWVILSEKCNLQTIIIGIIVCFSIAFLNSKFAKISCVNNAKLILKRAKYLTVYTLVLLKEIVIANIEVAKTVLSPKMNISPCMVSITTKLKTDFYKTLLANSITLTPGTITVALEGNTLTIHCLKKDYIEGLVNSKFEEILLKVEACK